MTAPNTPWPSSDTQPPWPLESLLRFAQEVGTITDRMALGRYIVESLSTLTHCSAGCLYVLESERSLYRHLVTTREGSAPTPVPALSFHHPLIETLRAHPMTATMVDAATGTPLPHAPLAEQAPPATQLALPLHANGHLLACALLYPTAAHPVAALPGQTWLSLALQIAANALAAVLHHEHLAQSHTLMRRTDRLRSLEIIAAGFAHEVRNPLTSIKTFIQLAPERRHDTDFFHDFSRIVLEDVHRIDRLIQEILDYARYKEPALTHEDVNDVVESCCSLVEKKAASRRIKIEKDLALELPRVMLDRQQFQQVILNLVLNAIDAMTVEGGTLTVATHRLTRPGDRPWVQIEIRDTGSGIAPDNLAHIFDPFFTTKPPSGDQAGTGLGLTIAHQIVQEHGGDIHVTSAVGTGTALFINVPASPATEERQWT